MNIDPERARYIDPKHVSKDDFEWVTHTGRYVSVTDGPYPRQTLYIIIPACTQAKIKAMEDSLQQCGEKGKDWTFDAIPTSPEHVRRFKVRTDMVETVRDICAQYNYILRTSL